MSKVLSQKEVEAFLKGLRETELDFGTVSRGPEKVGPLVDNRVFSEPWWAKGSGKPTRW